MGIEMPVPAKPEGVDAVFFADAVRLDFRIVAAFASRNGGQCFLSCIHFIPFSCLNLSSNAFETSIFRASFCGARQKSQILHKCGFIPSIYTSYPDKFCLFSKTFIVSLPKYTRQNCRKWIRGRYNFVAIRCLKNLYYFRQPESIFLIYCIKVY